MTGNIALDIFIGLVFIYLLYSLFAAVIMEIISVNLNIRAKNLKRAVFTMLNDEKKKPGFLIKSWWFISSIMGNGLSQKKGGLAEQFYESPGIKYLSGGGWVESAPSNISAEQFTKGLFFVMSKQATDQKSQAQQIKEFLEKGIAETGKDVPQEQVEKDGTSDIYKGSRSGLEYLQFLFRDANGDIDKFKTRLIQWYEETMLVATEWYKKRMQIWLFVIGFALAWSFNLNTLYITKILALNNKARDQMVLLASTYLEKHDSLPNIENMTDKELALYHKEIRKQAEKAADILSLPRETPDSIIILKYGIKTDKFLVLKDSITSFKYVTNKRYEDEGYVIFSQPEELPYLNIGPYVNDSDIIRVIDTLAKLDSISNSEKIVENGIVEKDSSNASSLKKENSKPSINLVSFSKTKFFLCYELWGYLITALALSLGAPFWFDLLNKLMQLRGSISQKKIAKETVTDNDSKSEPTHG